MNSHELAWAAGLFDGEGCVHAAVNRRNSRHYISPQLAVVQKDREVLDRFRQAVGVGRICGPYRQTTCPIYHYVVTRRKEIDYVIDLLWPYLSNPKRAQAKGVLVMHDEQKEITSLLRQRRKKTHCLRGHDLLDPANQGHNHQCLACRREKYAARSGGVVA